jgi:hypothetical protein
VVELVGTRPCLPQQASPVRPPVDAPVVALDIDGTSGDYHSHFTKFAEAWTGKEMPSPNAYTGGVHFSKHLGISRQTYNKIKLAYRQGGMKRSMPVYPGIGEFTRKVRENKCQVWICTTRPYLSLNGIEPDTRHWLRERAHIQYDGLLYGPHKYRDLVTAVGRERVLIVYDDLPAMIDVALDLGLRAAMREQPYNRQYDRNGNWCRVSSVADMWVNFLVELEKWKANNG